MIVIHARNVQTALPVALDHLFKSAIRRESRNGTVLQYPCPVTTVYQQPNERVLFWPERDANPFFHLYESLWMLAGRRDVAGVVRYAANMAKYSDYGDTFHAAYGHRWRQHFGFDQLARIAHRLQTNPLDRRSVLAMWDPNVDLSMDDTGKDFPCNDTATLQINVEGKLDLAVFCRSNDIVWGCYGANAVQFATLLEYMAHWIGVPVGTYTQLSMNWHGYTAVLDKVRTLPTLPLVDPYVTGEAVHYPLATPDMSHDELDRRIAWTLFHADLGFPPTYEREFNDDHPFWEAAYHMLKAHCIYKTVEGDKASVVDRALGELDKADSRCDWVVAGRQWLERRRA